LAVLSRSQAVWGIAVPAGAALIAVAAVTGGFAVFGASFGGTSATERLASADVSDLSANLPAAFAMEPSHHRERPSSRRTLTNAPSRGLLPLSQGADPTPLELLLHEGDRPLEGNGLCPPDMATIGDRYCVDRYEASLLEILPTGDEVPFSPYSPIDGHVVRAVSESGVFPQGYISGKEAQEACSRSGKRLCKPAEWRNACMGPEHMTYGYGNTNEPRRCNDHGRSPVVAMYGNDDLNDPTKWNWERMNNTMLNQLPGTLAHTGEHPDCTNDYGVYDMVGNLHEWVSDPNGTFQGGYYQDTQLNGEGCTYRTMAHSFAYHDYSTGFRCCADVAQ
jgi:formylglycine-generating enzyme